MFFPQSKEQTQRDENSKSTKREVLQGGTPSLLILSTLGTQIVFKVRLHLSRGVCKFDHSQHHGRAPSSTSGSRRKDACCPDH